MNTKINIARISRDKYQPLQEEIIVADGNNLEKLGKMRH